MSNEVSLHNLQYAVAVLQVERLKVYQLYNYDAKSTELIDIPGDRSTAL